MANKIIFDQFIEGLTQVELILGFILAWHETNKNLKMTIVDQSIHVIVKMSLGSHRQREKWKK